MKTIPCPNCKKVQDNREKCKLCNNTGVIADPVEIIDYNLAMIKVNAITLNKMFYELSEANISTGLLEQDRPARDRLLSEFRSCYTLIDACAGDLRGTEHLTGIQNLCQAYTKLVTNVVALRRTSLVTEQLLSCMLNLLEQSVQVLKILTESLDMIELADLLEFETLNSIRGMVEALEEQG